MASSDQVNPVAMPVENHRQPIGPFRHSQAAGPSITIDSVIEDASDGMPLSNVLNETTRPARVRKGTNVASPQTNAAAALHRLSGDGRVREGPRASG